MSSRGPLNVSIILLADDNPHARRMGTEILASEGHDVVTVDDGDQAISYLREHRPDLILTDTDMPGAGGYDVCGFVRSHSNLRDVKVVMLQPPLERYDERRAAEAGADGVLHKPLDARALIETVSSLLGLNGAGHPVKATAPQPPAIPKYEIKAPSARPEPPAQPADPFAQAVAEALAGPDSEQRLRNQIHSAAIEVLEAAVPALADRITDRVLQQLQKG